MNTNTNPADTFDPYEIAGSEYVPVREYYGRMSATCVAMAFPGEKGSGQKPVPYNPSIHTERQRFVQTEFRLSPLPEQQLSKPVEARWSNYDSDWTKITRKSLIDLGLINAAGNADIRRFDGMYCKLEWVEGFRKNKDESKGNYKTMKITGLYKNEADCRSAYQKEVAGGEAAASAQPVVNDPAKASALAFIESIIQNAWKVPGAQYEDVHEKTDRFIQENAAACAGLTVDSPEVRELLEQIPF